MRAVVQRVRSAQVIVEGRERARIELGLLVFVGIGRDDDETDLDYLSAKLPTLRLFEDDTGRMSRSVVDVGGAVLVVSQFTLYGDCRRGRRPSFDLAAPPAEARGLYEALVARLRATGVRIETGEFQAMMQVELVNDGPVTLLLDSSRGF